MKKFNSESRQFGHHHILAIVTALLTIVGVLFVFESSTAESFKTFGTQYHYLKQHLIGLALGLVAFFAGFFIPTKFWHKTSFIWYVLSIILLLVVFIPGVGLTLNGATRWISIAGIRFQPVEFCKFAVIIFYSNWLSKHQRFSPFLFLTALPAGLIILQPDLGSLLLLATIATALYFIAGGSTKKILGLGALAVPLLIVAIILSPYRLKRVTTFLNPEADPLGASFHIRQITLALGRGGLFGQGIGESQQKFSYIPEASTDSIFAIIAEELGFLGSVTILILYGLFLYHGYKIVTNPELAKETQLLGFGLIIWIGLQICINLSAIVALIPLKGMPLPFISFGRSALIMVLFATGILLHIGKKS